MRVLILGGTSFVGRTIVEDLLAHGHTPTIFNRGRTGAELFRGVERLVGDRDSGHYEALAGGSWDAVVDVCGYVPRHVEQALAALEDRFGRYAFISTGMVYDHLAVQAEITESSPRLPPHEGSEFADDNSYGPLRAQDSTEGATSTRTVIGLSLPNSMRDAASGGGLGPSCRNPDRPVWRSAKPCCPSVDVGSDHSS